MLGETSLKFSNRGVARMARLVAAAGFALPLAACNLTSVPFINDNAPPPASAPSGLWTIAWAWSRAILWFLTRRLL